MATAGRRVLKMQKINIKENLYLSDRILDKLEETDTIDEEISQKVRAERTNEEKIDKLLYHLKRRGPKAFSHFLEALKTDPANEMLAGDLEFEYYNAVRNKDKQSPPLDKVEIPKDINDNHITQTISMSDSLRHLESARELQLQDNLSIMYTRLKGHMIGSNLRELSFKSPKPITFQMVVDLLDDYLKAVDECYKTLGVKDKTKSLKSHIVDIKAKERQLKDEIKDKEHQRNKLSHQYMKLENKHREINTTLKEIEKKNQDLTLKIEEVKTLLNTAEDKLKSTEDKLEETMQENSELRHQLQTKGKEKHTEITHEQPQTNTDTNYSDYLTSSPSRAPIRVNGRRRRSTIGIPFQNYRTQTSPRRQYSQHIPKEQSGPTNNNRLGAHGVFNIENEYRVNPHVKFDRNPNSTCIIKPSNSQISEFVISNMVKSTPVVADCVGVTNEPLRNMRKNGNSKLRTGKS